MHIPASHSLLLTKFRNEDWNTVAVLAEDRAVNAMTACEQFQCSPEELEVAFRATEAADISKVVKLGGGFYCCLFSVGDHAPLYGFNAFYMKMRSKFVGPSSHIHYYSVEWAESTLPWAQLWGDLLGPTDLTNAPESSIRGNIFKNCSEQGLTKEPTIADNGMHASASPLEGLCEKMNWLEKAAD